MLPGVFSVVALAVSICRASAQTVTDPRVAAAAAVVSAERYSS